MFMSFDVTAMPCGSAQDAATLRGMINKFYYDPAQLMYRGGALLSTFGGEGCGACFPASFETGQQLTLCVAIGASLAQATSTRDGRVS